jgi:hypothetical protein
MTSPTNDPFTVPADAAAESIAPDETSVATDEPNATPAEDDLYDFVRMPNGSVRAVLKSDVHDEPATETQNILPATLAVVPEQQFYVHLANGDVVRVKEKDLPASAGTNATNGHWQRDDKVYLIIGVYPVEDIVKGN